MVYTWVENHLQSLAQLPPPTIKHPTKTPTPHPKHNPSIKHTSNITLPAIICKDYEVDGGRYDG